MSKDPDLWRAIYNVPKPKSAFLERMEQSAMSDIVERLEDCWNSQGARAMSEWQPIETAPKDGRVVLLCVKVNGSPFVATGGYDSHWTGQCWVLDNRRIPSGSSITHWMPLPKPPADAVEAAGAESND
ncbi:MAG: DUF551 domain-containing protein [Cupriavidus sp.]|nr:DUF551 domain-containing protein [Cupriavidus sp.]